MSTVAEGIETPIQLEIVRDLGIEVGQGYLLGLPSDRPVAGSIDVLSLLSANELAAAVPLASTASIRGQATAL
jgi:EAL domain-containing protein (putative c-di-GMP-specific phosphodiesterase class I)